MTWRPRPQMISLGLPDTGTRVCLESFVALQSMLVVSLEPWLSWVFFVGVRVVGVSLSVPSWGGRMRLLWDRTSAINLSSDGCLEPMTLRDWVAICLFSFVVVTKFPALFRGEYRSELWELQQVYGSVSIPGIWFVRLEADFKSCCLIRRLYRFCLCFTASHIWMRYG